MTNKCDCIIEVECEVIEQEPIEIDLEVKQYFDGAGQKAISVIFDETNWVQNEKLYSYDFGRDTHGLSDFIINHIYLFDETSQTYRPAMCDYITYDIHDDYGKLIDTRITLYSEWACKGKIILFGQVITGQ